MSSEVEESLVVFRNENKIELRDVSTSLDMTENQIMPENPPPPGPTPTPPPVPPPEPLPPNPSPAPPAGKL
jgi:hypothetical protein